MDIISGKILPEQLNNYNTFIQSKEFKNTYTKTKEKMTTIW
jgi:hypothetical protein